MGKARVVYGTVALAICAMVLSCDKNNPVQPLGNVIFSEGFEGGLSNYRQVSYYDQDGMMSISTKYARSGKGSLTSDSNNTSIQRTMDPAITDSIAGLQFYLMATSAAQTNFIAAICLPGSSSNGLFTIFGMGIDKSDSLKYVYEKAPNDIANESKTFAALKFFKWYKCKIEYNYSDTTLTYYVDDAVVGTRNAPSPMSLQRFVVMRDGLGAQGPAGYYIDDVTIYKR